MEPMAHLVKKEEPELKVPQAFVEVRASRDQKVLLVYQESMPLQDLMVPTEIRVTKELKAKQVIVV